MPKMIDPAVKEWAVKLVLEHQAEYPSLFAAITAENTVVGGMLSRGPNGEFLTDEMSGHYGSNWTGSVWQQFLDFISGYGLDVDHATWGGG